MVWCSLFLIPEKNVSKVCVSFCTDCIYHFHFSNNSDFSTFFLFGIKFKVSQCLQYFIYVVTEPTLPGC